MLIRYLFDIETARLLRNAKTYLVVESKSSLERVTVRPQPYWRCLLENPPSLSRTKKR